MEIAGSQLNRRLFWHLATIGPFVLFALLALLVMSRYRRAAAMGLLICTVGAILVALVFHYTYALGIWAGHDSAIRYLDEGALRAGFAASAVCHGLGVSICAAWLRWGKPRRRVHARVSSADDGR